MDCCETDGFKRPIEIREEPTLSKTVKRRAVLKGAGLFAGTAPLVAGGTARGLAKSGTIQLAFCSAILCVAPFEVTREGGYFRDEGLDVNLVYMRGSTAARKGLVGGAVDYAGTSLDDVVEAVTRGAEIKRFSSTARLPLLSLAIAPGQVAEINSFKDLEGRTVGVVSLGSIAHSLTLFLMRKSGADGQKVKFAQLGPNIYDPVRLGQVDAAWVNEPALSLLVKQGGRALVNFMETDDADKYLGGRCEFKGMGVRTAEIAARRDEMRALVRALEKGLVRVQSVKPEGITGALPKLLLAGVDAALLTEIFGRYRSSLYPTMGAIDVAACERVVDPLKFTTMINPDITATQTLHPSIPPPYTLHISH